MSYNGSGTFVINTAGQPVVSGTVISSTAFNALTADLATGLSTAITKDGQTTPTANIPMGNNKITNLAVGTAATDAANLSQVQSTTAKLVNSISGADTITGTMSPNLAAYATGQMFYFIAAGDNTGAVTLNIDSLGAKSVTRDGSVALAAGDIKSGEVVVVVYDGTRFQVVSQINSSGNATFANVSITSALNVGGVATFSAGTAAAPSITTSGDTNNGIFFPATDVTAITTAGSERLRVDASGNLGLGVTPSAWNTVTPLQIKNASFSGTTSQAFVGNNWYYNSGDKYISTAAAGLFQINGDVFTWLNAASGTAGNAITFTERMRLDASGNFLVGTTTANGIVSVVGNQLSVGNASGSSALGIQIKGTALAALPAAQVQSYIATGDSGLGTAGDLLIAPRTDVGCSIRFVTGTTPAERARITAGGLLLVNTTSGTSHIIKRDTSDTVLTVLGNGGVDSVYINSVNATGASLVTAAAIYAQKNNASGRSINAAGTINASGADYAEYMIKAGDFTIAKGDVCGIDANGKLTNVFADSVSFVVKSTNPSYVGGDTWASEELIGKKPTDEEELKKWYERGEENRQKVDRIAFAGQVPVNVLGATPGQYIVPVDDNGAIKGVAVSNPTFEQYQSAVGKVIAVQDDGRALIIVKVA